jgi:hypothetical protein
MGSGGSHLCPQNFLIKIGKKEGKIQNVITKNDTLIS